MLGEQLRRHQWAKTYLALCHLTDLHDSRDEFTVDVGIEAIPRVTPIPYKLPQGMRDGSVL